MDLKAMFLSSQKKRFIVDVSCRGCKMDVLHSAIKDMNLSRFKGLE